MTSNIKLFFCIRPIVAKNVFWRFIQFGLTLMVLKCLGSEVFWHHMRHSQMSQLGYNFVVAWAMKTASDIKILQMHDAVEVFDHLLDQSFPLSFKCCDVV